MDNPAFPVIQKTRPTFYFIGVTTGQSSIMRIFPLWMQELGRPEVVIEGLDLPLHARPEAYRAAVAQIKSDPLSLGALVTTHKVDLYAAAQDMFDSLDANARLCRELSCISKRNGRLEGHAKDPLTCGMSLEAITGVGYFGRTGAEALCLGAGGAAVALLLYFLERVDPSDRPRRFILVDVNPGRLDEAEVLAGKVGGMMRVETVLNADPGRNDALMLTLPAHSLVINATGLGKDRPGSPLSAAGIFPYQGIAWDFNYRGDLLFLRQARDQADERRLLVEDGWSYFLHGWTQVIAQVLQFELDDATFQRLARIAERVRG